MGILSFGVGVGVGVATLRRRVDGTVNFFVGVTGAVVGVCVDVTEGPDVIVGVISELSVAVTVDSTVAVGVKLSFADSLFSTEALLDFVPKKYEDTPISIASSNRTIIITTFFLTTELYY